MGPGEDIGVLAASQAAGQESEATERTEKHEDACKQRQILARLIFAKRAGQASSWYAEQPADARPESGDL